jgi:hypothetical protein
MMVYSSVPVSSMTCTYDRTDNQYRDVDLRLLVISISKVTSVHIMMKGHTSACMMDARNQ